MDLVPTNMFCFFQRLRLGKCVEDSVFCFFSEIDIGKCVEDSVRMFCTTPTSATYRQHALPVGRERKNSGFRTCLVGLCSLMQRGWFDISSNTTKFSFYFWLILL